MGGLPRSPQGTSRSVVCSIKPRTFREPQNASRPVPCAWLADRLQDVRDAYPAHEHSLDHGSGFESAKRIASSSRKSQPEGITAVSLHPPTHESPCPTSHSGQLRIASFAAIPPAGRTSSLRAARPPTRRPGRSPLVTLREARRRPPAAPSALPDRPARSQAEQLAHRSVSASRKRERDGLKLCRTDPAAFFAQGRQVGNPLGADLHGSPLKLGPARVRLLTVVQRRRTLPFPLGAKRIVENVRYLVRIASVKCAASTTNRETKEP